MALDIPIAIRDGFDRTVQRSGLIVVGIIFGLRLVRSVVEDSFMQPLLYDVLDYEAFLADLQAQQGTSVEDPLAGEFPLSVLDLPVELLGGLLLVMIVVGLVVRIGVIRTLTSGETETVPPENFTDRLGSTLLNLVVGTLVYLVVVGAGLVLILPGIYLAVALFFYNYEIIVEGKGAIEALRGSWSLTAGHRLPLFGLGVVVTLVGVTVGVIGGLFVPSTTVVGTLLDTLVSTIVAVFGIAVAARAYNQLRGESEGPVAPTDDLTDW